MKASRLGGERAARNKGIFGKQESLKSVWQGSGFITGKQIIIQGAKDGN